MAKLVWIVEEFNPNIKAWKPYEGWDSKNEAMIAKNQLIKRYESLGFKYRIAKYVKVK